MLLRDAGEKLRDLTKGFSVIAVTGPRQSGKTTLVQAVFEDYEYVSLEDIDIRTEAQEDPRGFLNRLSKNGFIIDEAQYAPDLFSYIQGMADNASKMGAIVLTGSQNFLLMERLSQTLAGRVGWIELLPFRYSEVKSNLKNKNLDDCVFQGLYPPLYDRPVDARDWYPRYVQTYVDRDVRLIKNIGNLSLFQKFIKLCAGRIGQLLNFSNLANECGIDVKTAQSWMSILETGYVVFLLKPHHKNFNKRLVKQSKLYFVDTGVACSLLGILEAKQVSTHYMRGALFENYIVMDYLKKCFNAGRPSNLFFWRDHVGHEIDLILEQADNLQPIEIKSGATLNSDMLGSIEYFAKLAKHECASPVLVYGGDRQSSRKNILIKSWRDL